MKRTTSMCDLPAILVKREILSRVPITSLGAVRATCKLWDALTKDWILGEAAMPQQFLGFVTKNSKVCSARFHLYRSSSKNDEEDFPDLSITQVGLLDQVYISRVFHCDGLLLCVAKDNLRLVVWNPYLGQTQWIRFTAGFHRQACYALGYDINRNHKILRSLDPFWYEIYELSSNSWRVLEVTSDPEWEIDSHISSVSLKGNAYFYAYETINNEYFLLCFDFTKEKFGSGLSLPFYTDYGESVALSCLKDEKLAVLYLEEEGVNFDTSNIVQIWVTTKIEPNYVSWSKFLRVKMKPFAIEGIRFCRYFSAGSFFIDEEEKVAVVFDFDGYLNHTAFVIGEGGYFESVSLGVAHNITKTVPRFTDNPVSYNCYPLVWSSSYLPS